jgi:hypothetical protein
MRGTAAGERVVSQANTNEFSDGYERVFGDKPPKRGTWVWDPGLNRLVPADEYRPPARALDAPIMAGRFYENQATLDGDDIGSRSRYKEYLRTHGVTHASDYREHYVRKTKEREKVFSGDFDHRARRDAIGRAMYQVEKGYKPKVGHDHDPY